MALIEEAKASERRRWSVDAFARFWANSGDPAVAANVIWPEIKGYWPRAKGPLVGKETYIQGLADFIAASPGFSARVTEHATNGDVTFLRWEATADFAVGPREMSGVDRMIVRDGHVLENRVHSDHPLFVHLAERGVLG